MNGSHPMPFPMRPEMDLVYVYESFYLTRYLIVASCAWLYFDYFLTAQKEVELVWYADTGFAKLAFLLFRYASLAGITLTAYTSSGEAVHVTDRFCRYIIIGITLTNTIVTAMSDILVILHIAAIWSRSVKILSVLTLCFFISTGVTLASRIAAFWNASGMCTPPNKSWFLIVYWAAPLFFDAVVVAFISFNGLSRIRDPRTDPLLYSLGRDGILYFLEPLLTTLPQAIFVIRFIILFMTVFSTPYSTAVAIPASTDISGRLPQLYYLASYFEYEGVGEKTVKDRTRMKYSVFHWATWS
ncbi:hypothetical protein BU17DRAFT_66989 [Hysterangium stoloniferum]|nr:hypothetical protein BU17DRAFT_66989 [Hysterangium stoloniferum]